MEAGTTPTTKLRSIMAVLGAALLGALLTLTWINALAAQDTAPELQTTASYDFTISKAAIPSIFAPGGNYLYQYAIAATGYTAGAATTIYIDDPLPTGVTWIPVNTSAWECVSLSTSIRATCFYSNTNTTTFVPLRIQVLLNRTPPNPVVDDEIVNTVTVSTIPEDRDITNNSATITTVTTNQAVDLSIRKSVTPTTIDSGEIQYTLTFSNTQPVLANGVWISDTLPSGIQFISADTIPSEELPALRTYRWNIGQLAQADGVRTITIRANVPTGLTGQLLTNAARITSTTPDRDMRNNYATVTIQPGTLLISKNSPRADQTVQVGELFEYTIVVQNPTNTTFRSVIVSDTLQPGLDFVSSSFGIIYNPTTRAATYNASSFPGRAQTTLRLQVRPSTSVIVRDTITNTAKVSWVSNNIRSTLESNEIEVNAIPAGTLDVDVSDGLSEVIAGTAISYTINVTNTGNLPVSNVRIESDLTQYVTALSITANVPGDTACPRTDLCTFRLINSLAAGGKFTLRVAARVNQNAPGNQYVSNFVTAAGRFNFEGERTTEGTAEDSTLVKASPVNQYKISASKGVSPSQAQVNESFNFRIRVTNEGDVTIPAVRVTDEFEPVLDLTSVTTNRGTATMNTGAKTIDVNVGDLAPGQEVRIDVVARVNTTVTKVETYDNRAKVTFSGGDIRSNTIRYRVLPGATLPGTGLDLAPPPAPADPPAALPAEEPHPLAGASLAMLGLGLLGMLAAMLLLASGLFAWIRKPLRAGGTIRLSLVLAAISAGLLVGGWALAGSLPEPPDQVGILTGAKPPLATRLAATQTAAEVPAVASGETSETEAPSLPLSLPTDTPAAVETQPPLFEPTPTLRALPDYPIPSPTAMVAQGPGGIPPDSSAITRLVIPSIDLDTVVKYVPFDGRTWLIGGLRQEVAWMGDTSWPGLGSNTGLAGHVDLADGSAGPFADLKNLRAGDQIQVYTEKNRFNYTVRAQSVVDDHDLTVIAATAGPQLTLITCTGMDPALGVYLARLIVFADLANVQSLTAAGN